MPIPKIAIFVDTATGWGRGVIRGVLDYVRQHQAWDLGIEPKGREEGFSLNESKPDGVIARVISEEMAEELKRLRIPTVNVSGAVLGCGGFPQVTTDRGASARLAETHFRDRGLSEFAYVGPLHLSHVRLHERAFEETLRASGARCHLYQPPGNGTTEASDEHLGAWLEALPKPIGIYTWGARIGPKVVSACRKMGIAIPHDVAVLGGDFDDLLCDTCHPAVSGVVTPVRQIGYKAASVLDAMLKGGKTPGKPILLEPERIEERLSTDTLAVEDAQCRKALQYLRSHACEDIQVEDILKRVPIARRSLERRFMQAIGRTPAQEITRIRINRSRELLSQTDMSLQEIAEACGYAAYNYWGTRFKMVTGLSPAKYRQKSRGL